MSTPTRLVLSRKEHEKVLLNIPNRSEPVAIELVHIGENQVKLSIEAEGDIEILREELTSKWN